jgi:DNA polymerase III alpha subunit (gram-positive type)
MSVARKGFVDVRMNSERFNNALFIYFDLETTGRSFRWNRICQICAIFTHREERVDEFSTIVDPRCKMPKSATAVHGITDDRTRDAPPWYEVGRTLKTKIKDLMRKHDAESVVFVAYNGNFDVRFLKAANEKMKINMNLEDTYLCDPLRIARSVHRSSQKGQHTLGAIYQKTFHEPMKRAHDARADVEAMMKVCASKLFKPCMRKYCTKIVV